jgi:glutathione S-transferase
VKYHFLDHYGASTGANTDLVPISLNDDMRFSFPVLFTPRSRRRPVREAVSIARAADAARPNPRSSPSLFPPESVVEIDRFVQASEVINCYGRDLMLTSMVDDPQTAALVVLPKFLRNPVVAKIVLRFFSRRLRLKYPQRPTREDVRTALHLLRAELAKAGTIYICGPFFTYADICMASCMYFAVDRREGSPKDKVYGDTQLLAEFDDLVQWRRLMFDNHYPGTEDDAFKFRPPAYRDSNIH